MKVVNEKIDRLLHDADQAAAGAIFAARIGHMAPSKEMERKCRRLKGEAEELFLANPGATWPDCEWPTPEAPPIAKAS